MPKRCFLYLYIIDSFKEKIVQAANTDLFNPLLLKARNSGCRGYHKIYYFLYKFNQ